MIAAFEALRSEFRSAGAEGISLALVGFAILFFIAEKNRINENKNKLGKIRNIMFPSDCKSVWLYMYQQFLDAE